MYGSSNVDFDVMIDCQTMWTGHCSCAYTMMNTKITASDTKYEITRVYLYLLVNVLVYWGILWSRLSQICVANVLAFIPYCERLRTSYHTSRSRFHYSMMQMVDLQDVAVAVRAAPVGAVHAASSGSLTSRVLVGMFWGVVRRGTSGRSVPFGRDGESGCP